MEKHCAIVAVESYPAVGQAASGIDAERNIGQQLLSGKGSYPQLGEMNAAKSLVGAYPQMVAHGQQAFGIVAGQSLPVVMCVCSAVHIQSYQPVARCASLHTVCPTTAMPYTV